MRRHRNILVVLDGSEATFKALSESIRLAQWSRGRVTAIMVVPPYEGDLSLVGVKNVQGAILGSCEEILSGALRLAESMETRIDVVCEEGEPCAKIIEYAESTDQDLIVLGASQENSLLRLFLGSTVSGVIETGRRDVLIIPEGASIRWERALLVIDDPEREGALIERSKEIAESYGAVLTTAVSDIRTFRRLAREGDVHIILLGSRDRTGLRSLLTGRSIEAVLRGSLWPVLVMTG